MGKMFNLFGGKAAKEGVVATTAVKGNRKATMNDTHRTDHRSHRRENLQARPQEEDLRGHHVRRTGQKMREARERAQKDAPSNRAKRKNNRSLTSPRKNTKSTST